MNRKKFSKRIWAMISIAIVLLIPLLSSPAVAAGTGTYNCYSDTDMTQGGPTAQSACPPPLTISGSGANLATFTCTYTFTDSYPTPGIGSWHKATLTVSPGGSISTNYVFIPANGGTVSGTISIGPLAYSPPTSWEVTLETWCDPAPLPPGSNYAYSKVTVTVTG